MAPSKETIEPADFIKLGGEVVLQDSRNGLPQYRCRVCPRLSARRWSKSHFQRHLSSGAHYKNLQFATRFSDDRAASPSTLPSSPYRPVTPVSSPPSLASSNRRETPTPSRASSPYRTVTPVSSRGSVSPAVPPSVRTSPTRSDLGSPVRVADATEDVRADLALRGLPTTDEFVSISTNLRHSAMVDDPFRMALEVLMASVARSAGKVANTTSFTMSSGGDKAKLREPAAKLSLPRVAGSRSRSSR